MLDYFTKTITLVSSSIEETKALGRKISSQIKPGSILCLEGDLGVGKTILSKSIISHLANISEEEIQSPTFVYLNIYDTPLFPICHFDLYRINSCEDFKKLGFLDYFDTSHVCLIEWSSKIDTLLPEEALLIHFSHVNETKRAITLSSSKRAQCQ